MKGVSGTIKCCRSCRRDVLFIGVNTSRKKSSVGWSTLVRRILSPLSCSSVVSGSSSTSSSSSILTVSPQKTHDDGVGTSDGVTLCAASGVFPPGGCATGCGWGFLFIFSMLAEMLESFSSICLRVSWSETSMDETSSDILPCGKVIETTNTSKLEKRPEVQTHGGFYKDSVRMCKAHVLWILLI